MFEGLKSKDKQEVVAKRQQEKKQKLLGSIKLHKGHTLFKVHKKTLEITKAEYVDNDTITYKEATRKEAKPIKGVDVDGAGLSIKRKKVLVDPDYYYISALNITSVQRKIEKAGLKKQ